MNHVGVVISQISQLIGLEQTRHLLSDRRHRDRRSFEDAALALLMNISGKVERVSKELLDAVAGVTGQMQKIADAQAANHTQTLATLEALKAALGATAADPDVAAAIEALGNASAAGTCAGTERFSGLDHGRLRRINPEGCLARLARLPAVGYRASP